MGFGSSKPEQNNPKQTKRKLSMPWQPKPKDVDPKSGLRLVNCIPEGTGGTFWLQVRKNQPPKPEDMRAQVVDGRRLIGTEKRNTGDGVFFAIGRNMCFCAHMDITVEGSELKTRPTAHEHAQIAREVRAKLERESRDAKWHVGQVEKDSLILCCPHSEFGGVAAAEGILDFLNLRNALDIPDRGPVSRTEHGFVADPYWPGPSWPMPYHHYARDVTTARKSLADFKLVPKKMPGDEWQYSCLWGWSASDH